MLKHVVMIKVKDGCDANRCHQLVKPLAQNVSGVLSVSCGFDVTKYPSSFDYCFVLEFADQASLLEYESSDYHQLIRNEIHEIRTVSHAVDFYE
ncbi:MAG: Dabb family protein [Eubacteriales bacterium]